MCINELLASVFLLLLAMRAQPTVCDATTPTHETEADALNSPRIVGGTNATAGQFPYQVSLRKEGRHICGGAIITSNYIVTAAHCVRAGLAVTPASALTVRAGSVQRTASDPTAVLADVAEVKVHPGFGVIPLRNDVALLRLAQALNFSAHIAAIPLASADPPSRTEVLITGFGRISAAGPLSEQLLYASVSVISNMRCRLYIPFLSRTVICLLHSRGTGACNGDSGGPAIANGQLIGIASFAKGTCAGRAPDGYAKVSVLRNWLVSNSDL